MSQNETKEALALRLQNMTQEELNALANNLSQERGPPVEEHNGEKNTLYGWTEDGKGVWVLPMSKTNFHRFEEIAKTFPNMGHDSMEAHCEIMRLAGAEFFADWRDSDRARGAKEPVEEVEDAERTRHS